MNNGDQARVWKQEWGEGGFQWEGEALLNRFRIRQEKLERCLSGNLRWNLECGSQPPPRLSFFNPDVDRGFQFSAVE